MKIVCDSCSAKYSIADEKVAGKVFKIRCKKCSAVIVVRGDQLPATGAEASPLAPSADQDAVWHVVVDGDQQGPFAPVQIGEMLTAGTIDWEVYVWREGFDGWLAARDVPELVEAVTGQSQDDQADHAAADMHSGSAPPGAHDPFAATNDPFAATNDPFAASDPYGASGGVDPYGGTQEQPQASPFAGGSNDLFGAPEARAHSDVGADLFAQSEGNQSPFDGGPDDDVVASSPSPRVSAEQASMTGQRNENSVLFSLANLQALATGSGDGPAAAPQTSAPSSRPGHAVGEGSGLIDIRALASTTGLTGPSSVGASRPKKDSVDDLLSIGTGAPLGASLGAPVLAPVHEETGNKGLMYSIIAAAAIVAIAAVAIVVVIVSQDPDPVAQAAGPATVGGAITPGADGTNSGNALPPTTPNSAGDVAPSGTTEAAAVGGAEDERDEDVAEDDDRGSRSGRRTARDRTPRRATGSSAAAREATPEPSMAEAPAPRRGGGDIDDLLEAALGGGGGGMAAPMAAPRATGGGGSGLPEQPSRDAVASALRSVAGPVRSCGAGQRGTANTTIVISGSTGRVQSARVAGQFAGTPVGQCVARAVRAARFPRFSRPTFSVTFPYSI
jgi:predicted Zn finger-like uncharacterized protein